MILVVCPNPSVDTLISIERLLPGEVHRARKVDYFPGGKGVHVALAAHELGEEVCLLAIWAGPTGDWIRSECEKAGVRCDGPEVPGWSRSCITLRTSLDAAADETEILGVGPQVTADCIAALRRAFERHIESAKVVVCSGSWPPGAPPHEYSELVRLAGASGCKTIVDCTGDALHEAIKARPFAIHLNRIEARELLSSIEDIPGMSQALAERCRIAALTDAKRGAVLAEGSRKVHASCLIDQPLGTVGAGDCFVAGMAVAIERALPLEEVARFACAAGAANCMRPEIGLLHRHDFEQLLPRVEVRSLS